METIGSILKVEIRNTLKSDPSETVPSKREHMTLWPCEMATWPSGQLVGLQQILLTNAGLPKGCNSERSCVS